jgi:carbamoyl-phosphate synthase large subunit
MEKMGFSILATEGTHEYLKKEGVVSRKVLKVHEGTPNIADLIQNRDIHLVFNTPAGKEARIDDKKIRQNAVRYHVPIITTPAGIRASVAGIKALKGKTMDVRALQEWYQGHDFHL